MFDEYSTPIHEMHLKEGGDHKIMATGTNEQIYDHSSQPTTIKLRNRYEEVYERGVLAVAALLCLDEFGSKGAAAFKELLQCSSELLALQGMMLCQQLPNDILKWKIDLYMLLRC